MVNVLKKIRVDSEFQHLLVKLIYFDLFIQIYYGGVWSNPSHPLATPMDTNALFQGRVYLGYKVHGNMIIMHESTMSFSFYSSCHFQFYIDINHSYLIRIVWIEHTSLNDITIFLDFYSFKRLKLVNK